MQKTK